MANLNPSAADLVYIAPAAHVEIDREASGPEINTVMAAVDAAARARNDLTWVLDVLAKELIALEMVFGTPALAEPLHMIGAACDHAAALHTANDARVNRLLEAAGARRMAAENRRDELEDELAVTRASLAKALRSVERHHRAKGTRFPHWYRAARDLVGGEA